jgi:hypothetical protein
MKLRSVLFRFENPTLAAHAVLRLQSRGAMNVEAFGPYPNEELTEAVGQKPSKVPLCALLAGIGGGICALWLQCFTAIDQYPLNVGGRPLFSWPAFMPVTFELIVLGAAGMIIVAFLVSTGLPRLHHPVFEVAEFARASDDRFFVCAHSSNHLDPNMTLNELAQTFGAEEAYEIPHV